MPSSGEPQHPPALVVRLRGRQHSGAVLWVEPASEMRKIFPQTAKASPQAALFAKHESESSETRRPLKTLEIWHKYKQTFLKGANMRDSGGLTLTYIGSHLRNGMLILESVCSSCQLWFPLNHRKLKAALKYLVAWYADIYKLMLISWVRRKTLYSWMQWDKVSWYLTFIVWSRWNEAKRRDSFVYTRNTGFLKEFISFGQEPIMLNNVQTVQMLTEDKVIVLLYWTD